MPPPAKRRKTNAAAKVNANASANASGSTDGDADAEVSGRCPWADTLPEVRRYHDEEWGVPNYDDGQVFEFLILETFQAGLSWLLILRKRANFAAAFHNFDVDKMAAMTEADVQRLLQDTGIVRNKLKIRAAISNARIVTRMRDEEGLGLADYFWRWVDYEQQVNYANGLRLTTNQLSDDVAKDLKKRGFKFVGSTVIYSHLQATGVINDHAPTCPQFEATKKMVRKPPAAKQTGTKETAAKKPGAAQTAAKKPGAAKTAAKKSGDAKSAAKKTAAKKSGTKKSDTKKSGTKK